MTTFAMMNEIKLEDLSIGYRHKIVAKGLSCELSGGVFTCLIGRNGLGKSTLLRTLSGFQPPLAGSVVVYVGDKAYNISSVDKATLSRLVSVVLTERIDVSNITVYDVVSMGRMPYTDLFGTLRDEDKHVVDEALRLTGMADFAARDISTLSDGERQKVMIARALAQQTPVLLLDEPTAFLDYHSKVETMNLLHRLAKDMGKIVLASTHDLDIALRTTDRLLTIHDGIEDVSKEKLACLIGK